MEWVPKSGISNPVETNMYLSRVTRPEDVIIHNKESFKCNEDCSCEFFLRKVKLTKPVDKKAKKEFYAITWMVTTDEKPVYYLIAEGDKKPSHAAFGEIAQVCKAHFPHHDLSAEEVGLILNAFEAYSQSQNKVALGDDLEAIVPKMEEIIQAPSTQIDANQAAYWEERFETFLKKQRTFYDQQLLHRGEQVEEAHFATVPCTLDEGIGRCGELFLCEHHLFFRSLLFQEKAFCIRIQDITGIEPVEFKGKTTGFTVTSSREGRSQTNTFIGMERVEEVRRAIDVLMGMDDVAKENALENLMMVSVPNNFKMKYFTEDESSCVQYSWGSPGCFDTSEVFCIMQTELPVSARHFCKNWLGVPIDPTTFELGQPGQYNWRPSIQGLEADRAWEANATWIKKNNIFSRELTFQPAGLEQRECRERLQFDPVLGSVRLEGIVVCKDVPRGGVFAIQHIWTITDKECMKWNGCLFEASMRILTDNNLMSDDARRNAEVAIHAEEKLALNQLVFGRWIKSISEVDMGAKMLEPTFQKCQNAMMNCQCTIL